MEIFEGIQEESINKIPKEIGDRLIRENNSPNHVILIHRGLADNKQAIFNNGLFIKGGTELAYTTDRYDSNLTFMINVRDSYTYKNPDMEDAVCVILKIPKEYLKYETGKTKPILRQTEDMAEQSGGFMIVDGKYQSILLPEFVLGAVEYSNGEITGFSENENYKEEHTYSNEGLVCADEVIYDYHSKKQTPLVDPFDTYTRNLQNKQANDRIIQENEEYVRNGFVTEDYERIENPISEISYRTEDELKVFSLQKMRKSKFIEIMDKFKSIFRKKENTKEKNLGENEEYDK